MTQTRFSRSRRLVLLYRLRMAGVLENLTLRQISRVMGVRRSALLKDLNDLDTAEEEFQDLLRYAPWTEFDSVAAKLKEQKVVDEEVEALKRLVRDGLVWMENWVSAEENGGGGWLNNGGDTQTVG